MERLLYFGLQRLAKHLKIASSLAHAILLTYPALNAPLAIFTDASDFTVGAALQQQVKNEWQSVGFFSKKTLQHRTVHY